MKKKTNILLIILFIILTSCIKDYNINPTSTILRFLLQGPQ